MGILFITLVVLIIFIVISHYWDTIINKSMTYNIYLEKNRVFVDENIGIFTEITNKKIMIIPFIRVLVEIPKNFIFNNSKIEAINEEKSLLRILTSLLWFEKIKRDDSFRCNKRGVYKIKTAIIEVRDFIGYKKAYLRVNFPQELIVYPRIKNLMELIYFSKSFQGDISVRRWIINDPTQVIGLKKYESGDGFNTIDWKMTAKRGELFVRKFDFTSDPSIMTFLDIQTEAINWMRNDYELLEKGIEIVASIMDKALKEKIAVGYTANTVYPNEQGDIFIYPSNSSKQRDRILEALAKTSYRRTYSINVLINDTIVKLNKNCTIMLLLSYISKEVVKSLNYYAESGYNIKIILLNNCCNITGINKKIDIIHSIEERGDIACSIS